MVFVYPGTFDPVTLGHIDVIERASRLCDKMVVAILDNVSKKSLFTVSERAEHLKRALSHLQNIEVTPFSGLQIHLPEQTGADAIIRGVRGAADLDFEMTMVYGNRAMRPDVETLFIPTSPAYAYLSSSLVKEIAAFGGDLSGMVPPFVAEHIDHKMNKSS